MSTRNLQGMCGKNLAILNILRTSYMALMNGMVSVQTDTREIWVGVPCTGISAVE